MLQLPEIVRSPSLSATARRLVQDAIWSGMLPPGSHLVEMQLAEQFQISRGPLREALRSLAAEGLVEIQPGRGTFVADPTADEMQDMIILRAVLGGMAARYVAASGDVELFDKLAVSIGKMRAAAINNQEREFFDEHWVFFELMHRAANDFIFRAWQSLYGLINIYVRRLGRPHLPLQRILSDYERFLELLRAGDPDEAEAVVRSEMLLVGFRVLERPLPSMLHAYVTRRICEDGTIVTFDPKSAHKPKGSARSTRDRQ